MRAVIQRVIRSKVKIDGQEEDRGTGPGLVIFLAVGKEDSLEDARYLADKISVLRLFDDKSGKMNLSIRDIQGEALIISQFTLYADCTRGRRPDFTNAARPDHAERLYEEFVGRMRLCLASVKTGCFGARMLVDIANDGPVTCILDTKR